MLKNILYLHGFNSDPESFKAKITQKFAHEREINVVVPFLQGTPLQMLNQVQNLYENLSGPTLLIGSSLGGYLALSLAHYFPIHYMVLINPALIPQRHASAWLNQRVHSAYGKRSFFITSELIQQFWAVGKFQSHWRQCTSFLLSGADTVLSTQETLQYARGAHILYWPTAGHEFLPYPLLLPQLFERAQTQKAFIMNECDTKT